MSPRAPWRVRGSRKIASAAIERLGPGRISAQPMPEAKSMHSYVEQRPLPATARDRSALTLTRLLVSAGALAQSRE
jgi:hypothetical protein